MARLTDNEGRLLGGLPDARTGLSPMYGPEETVPGLMCGYGTRACAHSGRTEGRPAPRRICHNSVETPEERHHCDDCGGDYCTLHAEPVAHDCAAIIAP